MSPPVCRDFVAEDHTGDNLCQFYIDVFNEYEILDKVIAGTTDNGANFVASMEKDESKKWAAIRCFIHTLQLAVRDALKVVLPVLFISSCCCVHR